jgi:hypothetical protein|tara:strand:- start:372 stop:749 length:378 start_codon:yes stop_codon:yes gene_type:complete
MFGNIPRENHKYVYVRLVSSLASDDDHLSSVCFPVDAIRAIGFFSSTGVIMRHEGPYNYVVGDNGDGDSVILTIASGTQKQFMKEFLDEVSFGENRLIVLGDNVTNEYLSTVSSVLSVTVNVQAD